MPNHREARLKPEFAELYPPLEPGEWVSASVASARMLLWQTRQRGTSGLGKRTLDPQHFDFRGDFFNDDQSCAQFMTHNTPNSGVDSTVCVDANLPGPCLRTANESVASRSKHPGGVNVQFGDGSVRFVADQIALATWQAMGSSDWGDVVPEAE